MRLSSQAGLLVGGLAARSSGIKVDDPGANRTAFEDEALADAPDRSALAMGLASAWPTAEQMDSLRAGAAEALDLFCAGDVLGARKRWAEVGAMLTRRPKGKRGVSRLITHAGRSMTLTAWARELGWSPQALAYRLDVMPLDTALVPHAGQKA